MNKDKTSIHKSNILSSPLWNNVNKDKKFVFIHIPKTGGTSIVQALGLKNPSTHATYLQYVGLLDHAKEYFYFTFVRNPWARLVSFYRYARMETSMYHNADDPKQALFGKHLHYDLFSKISFKEMVYLLTEDRLVPYDNSNDFMRPQTYWLRTQYNSDKIHFTGKLENIQEDFTKLCRLLGIPSSEIPLANTSGGSVDYRSYFDDESKHLAAKYYAEDIETFEYSF